MWYFVCLFVLGGQGLEEQIRPLSQVPYKDQCENSKSWQLICHKGRKLLVQFISCSNDSWCELDPLWFFFLHLAI